MTQPTNDSTPAAGPAEPAHPVVEDLDTSKDVNAADANNVKGGATTEGVKKTMQTQV